MPPASDTASGFSPLRDWENRRNRKPQAKNYSDPIVFALDYAAWLRRLEGYPDQSRAAFDGPGEGENR